MGILVSELIQLLAVKLSVHFAGWKKDYTDSMDIKFALPIILCQTYSIMPAHHVFELCFCTYGEFEITAFYL